MPPKKNAGKTKKLSVEQVMKPVRDLRKKMAAKKKSKNSRGPLKLEDVLKDKEQRELLGNFKVKHEVKFMKPQRVAREITKRILAVTQSILSGAGAPPRPRPLPARRGPSPRALRRGAGARRLQLHRA